MPPLRVTGDVGLVVAMIVIPNIVTILFFVYALVRGALINKKARILHLLESGHNKTTIFIDGHDWTVDSTALNDEEKGFLADIIAEVMDLLNDTEDLVSFKRLGLVLRASSACYYVSTRTRP